MVCLAVFLFFFALPALVHSTFKPTSITLMNKFILHALSSAQLNTHTNIHTHTHTHTHTRTHTHSQQVQTNIDGLVGWGESDSSPLVGLAA
jgi:hypothetical protein